MHHQDLYGFRCECGEYDYLCFTVHIKNKKRVITCDKCKTDYIKGATGYKKQ